MIDNSIKERIRKLLTLAADKGATEDEAATAMRMAMGLMAKHGIDQSEIKTGEQPKATKGQKKAQRLDGHEVTLANAAAYLFGCRVVTMSRGKAGLYFVGRPDNIEAAEATMMFLVRQVEAFYKQALTPGLSQSERSEFRRTFKQACASRVQRRAYDLVENPKNNQVAAITATGKNALVVKGYFDQMFSEADDELAQISGLKTTQAKPKKWGSGTLAGRAAGDRVKLRQEVR